MSEWYKVDEELDPLFQAKRKAICNATENLLRFYKCDFISFEEFTFLTKERLKFIREHDFCYSAERGYYWRVKNEN
jgi:hypothetical protein